MADVETRFKKHLQGDSSVAGKVGDRIHNDHVPQDKSRPYVWYRRRLTTPHPTLGSAAGEVPHEFIFDVETIAKTNREAKQVAEYVRARLHCYRGTFDDSTVQGIFVVEQDSDYEPEGTGGDTGVFFMAFGAQVFI